MGVTGPNGTSRYKERRGDEKTTGSTTDWDPVPVGIRLHGDTTSPPAATATSAPQPTTPPTEAPTSAPQVQQQLQTDPLVELAAKLAGGPGAIYVGDLTQLAGPAPNPDLGGIDQNGNPDGSVPLDSLERHEWIYESPYYEEMLEKANLTDPTPLTTSGGKFEFQYSCVNRSLLPCKLFEHYPRS